jgi:hypothetical protein
VGRQQRRELKKNSNREKKIHGLKTKLGRLILQAKSFEEKLPNEALEKLPSLPKAAPPPIVKKAVSENISSDAMPSTLAGLRLWEVELLFTDGLLNEQEARWWAKKNPFGLMRW